MKDVKVSRKVNKFFKFKSFKQINKLI